MKFSLIICTYKRPKAICKLLDSVCLQSLIPDEIIVVDGSDDNATEFALQAQNYKLPISYFRVDEKNRGLTKQRNYGISKVDEQSEVVAFLDDDIVLIDTYFENIIKVYYQYEDCIGVGGYILNEDNWRKLAKGKKPAFFEYSFDGYVTRDDLRNLIRKLFGLHANMPPCYMPEFGHGRSVGSLPPSGKVYPVEYFMGGVASYRKQLFEYISFSEYFEGYGLYEDMDFTIRASKIGSLYVNTGAQLYHYHESSGRPNQFLYGKMVVRNGWYVWRVKYLIPSVIGRVKWNLITLLLILIRFSNVVSGPSRMKALTEAVGRTIGYLSLMFCVPKEKR